MPILLSPVPSSGGYRYEFVDRSGTVHDLTRDTSPRLFVTAGATGLGTPPTDVAADKLPFTAGSLVRHVATQPRRIELPIIIAESSISALVSQVDEVRDWFWAGDEQRRYSTYLRVTRPDGEIRQLQVFYTGGLDGDMVDGGPLHAQYVVSLLAPDPWPTAAGNDTASWLSTDGDLPTVSIINDGDLEAFPVWTITGPATSVNVNNTTTGKGWLYTSSLVGFNLASGKSLTIDTRFSPPRTGLPVVDSDGTSRFSSFHPASSMFTLAPGQNDFTITFAGNSGATEIEVSWLPRYFGLLR